MLAVYDAPLIKQGFFPWARAYLMHVLLVTLSPASSQSRSHLQHLLLPVPPLHPTGAVPVVCPCLCPRYSPDQANSMMPMPRFTPDVSAACQRNVSQGFTA